MGTINPAPVSTPAPASKSQSAIADAKSDSLPPHVLSQSVTNDSCQLASSFLLNIQGMNPTFHNQKYKPQALYERIKSSENFIPYFIITESHLRENIFDA